MDPPEIDRDLEQPVKSKSESFDVINPEQIDNLKKTAKRWGIDADKVAVTLTKPGEELFDREEIQYKLLTEKCGSDWDRFIKEYGFIGDVPIDQLRAAVQAEGVALDGNMPGFAMTKDGEGQITFFAVAENNLIPMAEKYAAKSGTNRHFTTPEEALKYLREDQAEVALAHEYGHVRFENLMAQDPESLVPFGRFVARQPVLRERVAVLQADKFDDPSQIPEPVLVEEAYADMFAGEMLRDVRGHKIENRINLGFESQKAS